MWLDSLTFDSGTILRELLDILFFIPQEFSAVLFIFIEINFGRNENPFNGKNHKSFVYPQ